MSTFDILPEPELQAKFCQFSQLKEHKSLAEVISYSPHRPKAHSQSLIGPHAARISVGFTPESNPPLIHTTYLVLGDILPSALTAALWIIVEARLPS